MTKKLSFLCLFFILEIAFCGQKEWIPNWNFDNPNNWKDQMVPCSGKAAVIPDNLEFPVYIPSDVSLESVSLPLNGEMIFEGSLSFGFSERDKNCADSRKDRFWERAVSDFWWNPLAWKESLYNLATDSSPVPHVHRVPCQWDTVKFPPTDRSSFRVILSSSAVRVSGVTIGNQTFHSSSSFVVFRDGDSDVNTRFIGTGTTNPVVLIESDTACRDKTSCLCKSELYKSEICGHVGDKCLSAQCQEPILMKGFCCPQCGAELKVKLKGSDFINPAEKLLLSLRDVMKEAQVVYYYALMEDNYTYVYFISKSGDDAYKEIAEKFKNMFNKEASLPETARMEMKAAGHALINIEKSRNILTVVILFVIMSVIALAVIVYCRKNKTSVSDAFRFMRIESGSRLSIVGSILSDRRNSAVLVPSYTRDGGMRFTNPGFDVPQNTDERTDGETPLYEAVAEEKSTKDHTTPLEETKNNIITLPDDVKETRPSPNKQIQLIETLSPLDLIFNDPVSIEHRPAHNEKSESSSDSS